MKFFTAVLVLSFSLHCLAGPLGDRVRSVTRNPENEFAVTQSLLTIADLGLLGISAQLVRTYRPEYNKIRVQEASVARHQAQVFEYKQLLSHIEGGNLTVIDQATKEKRINDARQALAALEEEGKELRSARHIVPNLSLQREQQVTARQSEILMESMAHRTRIETLEKLDIAAPPDKAAHAIRAKLTAAEAALRIESDELKRLKGSFAARFGKAGIRLIGTGIGLVAVVDLGARMYMIFLESADPGIFPAVEFAADAADESRPYVREMRIALQRLMRFSHEISSPSATPVAPPEPTPLTPAPMPVSPPPQDPAPLLEPTPTETPTPPPQAEQPKQLEEPAPPPEAPTPQPDDPTRPVQ